MSSNESIITKLNPESRKGRLIMAINTDILLCRRKNKDVRQSILSRLMLHHFCDYVMSAYTFLQECMHRKQTFQSHCRYWLHREINVLLHVIYVLRNIFCTHRRLISQTNLTMLQYDVYQ